MLLWKSSHGLDKRRTIIGHVILLILIYAIIVFVFAAIFNRVRPSNRMALSPSTITTASQPADVFVVNGTAAMPTISGSLSNNLAANHLSVALHGLKQIDASHIYTLWIIRVASRTMLTSQRIVVFRPSSNGSIHRVLPYQTLLRSDNQFVLTIERSSRSTTPTLPFLAMAQASN